MIQLKYIIKMFHIEGVLFMLLCLVQIKYWFVWPPNYHQFMLYSLRWTDIHHCYGCLESNLAKKFVGSNKEAVNMKLVDDNIMKNS